MISSNNARSSSSVKEKSSATTVGNSRKTSTTTRNTARGGNLKLRVKSKPAVDKPSSPPWLADLAEGRVPSMMEAALHYGRDLNVAVFPCGPDKRPLVSWREAASADEQQIRAWWTAHPDAMIGVPMGERNGVFAVDLDRPKREGAPDGVEAWATLEAEHGVAPATHTAETPTGGLHLLFRYDPARPVTNRVGSLKGLGIDVRGEGGFIVAAPSRRPDGLSYDVAPESFGIFADPPGWLIDALEEKPERQTAAAPSSKPPVADDAAREARWARAALDDEARQVAATTEGGRNDQLNRSSLKLGRIVGGGLLARAEVEQRLAAAALVAGLDHREAAATIRSGLTAGLADPKSVPERKAANGAPDDSAANAEAETAEAEGAIVSRKTNFAGQVDFQEDVERKEIIAELPKAGTFPLHALPPLLRDAVLASQDLSKAPLGLCADVGMTALALTTQGRADVRDRAHGGKHPLSTFVMTLGVSGERKSTVSGILMRPIVDWQTELRLAYKNTLANWKILHERWQSKVDTFGAITSGGGGMSAELNNYLRSNPEPVKPRHYKMLHSAPTAEGLKRAMRDGQLSSGLVSDEAGMFLEGHAMKKEQAVATMTILSSMWDGKAVDHERSKEEESYELHGRRLSVGFMVQPAIAKGFLADEKAQGQGFIARFLLSYPESTIGTRATEAAPEHLDPRLAAYYAYVADLLRVNSATPVKAPVEGAKRGNLSGLIEPAPVPEVEELDLPVIELRDGTEAWELWRTFNDEIEREKIENGVITGRYAVIRNTANKVGEQALRIAGQLHIFSGGAPDGELSGETMRAAIEIARYYLNEAQRLAGGNVVASGEQQALDRLSKYIAGHVAKRSGKQAILFTPRDIRSCPIESRDGETLKKRLATLVGLGHVRAVTSVDKTGRKVPIMLNGRSCKEVYAYMPREAA